METFRRRIYGQSKKKKKNTKKRKRKSNTKNRKRKPKTKKRKKKEEKTNGKSNLKLIDIFNLINAYF